MGLTSGYRVSFPSHPQSKNHHEKATTKKWVALHHGLSVSPAAHAHLSACYQIATSNPDGLIKKKKRKKEGSKVGKSNKNIVN